MDDVNHELIALTPVLKLKNNMSWTLLRVMGHNLPFININYNININININIDIIIIIIIITIIVILYYYHMGI